MNKKIKFAMADYCHSLLSPFEFKLIEDEEEGKECATITVRTSSKGEKKKEERIPFSSGRCTLKFVENFRFATVDWVVRCSTVSMA